jgi:hypothetical protein
MIAIVVPPFCYPPQTLSTNVHIFVLGTLHKLRKEAQRIVANIGSGTMDAVAFGNTMVPVEGVFATQASLFKNILLHPSQRYKHIILYKVPNIITNRHIAECAQRGINLFNMHPSYLPYFPGRSSTFRSIYETNTIGVTFHRVSEQIDGGPIVYRRYMTNVRFSDIGAIRAFYRESFCTFVGSLVSPYRHDFPLDIPQLTLDARYMRYALEQPENAELAYIPILIGVYQSLMPNSHSVSTP